MKNLKAISIKKLIIILMACITNINASGQFYNGLQMPFGKNKVQYYDFYWQFYRFDDFDCYFNEFGRDIAQFTADYALKKLAEAEDFFDYSLEKRIIFVIFNKNSEYRQSNIGLITFDEDSYNTGGFNRIIKNKVMLYYEGDHEAYKRQIAASINEVIINEMLYNADIKDRISSSSIIPMPEWYIKGLIHYVAGEWDYDAENRVKDGFKSGKYKKISHLEYDDAVDAGMSFWRFIGKKYGNSLIPNIIYLTKIYKNVDDGLLYVIGEKLKILLKDWHSYYENEFSGDQDRPDDANTLVRSKKEQIYQQVKVSPGKDYIAYVTNDWGRKRIWLYNVSTGKRKIIFRKEPRFEQVLDKTYPVIAWHPSGKILTFINDEKSDLQLYFYRVNEKKTDKRLLLYFDKVLDFSYSPDGTRLVFSAVKDGITDIYIHTIASGINEQITRDIADDLNPSFLKESPDQIIFSSNRLNDTLSNSASPFEKVSENFDLFTYDLAKKSNLVMRLSEGKYADRFQPSEISKNNFAYLGDQNGIYNRYTARFDSSISFIDTVAHYRYYINSQPSTNYDRNIINLNVATGTDSYGEVLFKKRKYSLRSGQLNKSEPEPLKQSALVNTRLREEKNKYFQKADSIEQLRQWLVAEEKRIRDTLKKPLYEYYIKNEPIDVNHYIFEKEKQNYYNQLWRKKYMDIDLDTGQISLPLIRIYETSFYNSYIATQIDFTFLNNSYQVYSGGAPYFNPGINLLTKIGTVDLFEDFRITGGFRFAGNFDSNEYLLSIENLKGVFDKQLIYHRQTYYSSDSVPFKTYSQNVYFSLAKPISPVLALKGTVSYRYDRHVFLSYDIPTLNYSNIVQHWGSFKGEVIYDNTRKRSINIYYGTRFKIWGEYYKEISRKKSDMFILGIDFRKYTKIHRELIWANRFAASTSFGPTKLLYYLGGVDNWMGYLFNKYPMFDNTIPVTPNVNYGFQALATNMRGFTQNVRNGNSFALINSEIRWPFIRYFAGHPLRSNFLNSLQIVAFGDVGTAWSGKSPWASINGYDTQKITNGPVSVSLETNKDPIVEGFGAGARAQLFGYFIRADWAWGIENSYILPKIFYLSFSLDF